MTYEKLQDFLSQGLIERSRAKEVRAVLAAIMQIITEKDIKLSYVKNVFENTEKLQIIIVTSTGNFLIASTMQNEIEVMSCNLRLIVELRLIVDLHDQEKVRLNIRFSNDQKVTLCSEKDCDLNWRNKYADHIKGIYKSLFEYNES